MVFFQRIAFAGSLFRPLVAAGCGIGLLALPNAHPAGWPHGVVCLLAAAVFVTRASRFPALRLLPWLIAGYLYAHWQMSLALGDRLPLCADASIRQFELIILDPPVRSGTDGSVERQIARFQARVQILPGTECLTPGSYRVRLSWYEPPALAAGERWRVEGRLRPPWGNLNPGGFDYERWLLGQGLAGTGYVRSGIRMTPAIEKAGLRMQIRQALRDWLEGRGSEHAGIMLALMSGDDSALDQSEWRALRESGTVHLLVVSGLHVGLVSGFLFLLGRGLARCSGYLLLRVGARRLSGLFALAGSGAYVWLSGFGVPAIRAWLMTAVLLLVVASGRSIRGLNVVLLVMALVLMADPLVVHQQGFWLSFVAVLALVGWFEPLAGKSDGVAAHGGIRALAEVVLAFVQVQIVLLLALSPLLAYFQGGAPLQAPLVNALVVPLVTFLVLPVLLLAALLHFPLPVLAEPLLDLAEATLGLVMFTVEEAAKLPATTMSLSGPWQWLLLVALLLWLRQRPAWWWLPVPLLLWWALLLPDGRMPPNGEFRLAALDVGQGSAILVDTHRHRLIFDAGPRYPTGFDLGDAVVVPSFQQLGGSNLDVLVISHDDLDHSGGARAVIEQLAPARILASYPLPAELGQSDACRAGFGWQWDGVSFRFLHPDADLHPESELTQGSVRSTSDNDSSCVLLISNGRRSVLLAGDISSRIERRLPKKPVDLLMAPHHGSRTSSSKSFVRGFAPAIVFVSTDRRSRFGHPHPDVVERYEDARLLVTGRAGALIWRSDVPAEVFSWRAHRAAYWQRQFSGLEVDAVQLVDDVP